MECISLIPKHLIHPFSATLDDTTISLSLREKTVAAVLAVATFVFGGMSPISAFGCSIVFYALTALFKYRNINADPESETIDKTQSVMANSSLFGSFGKDYDDIPPSNWDDQAPNFNFDTTFSNSNHANQSEIDFINSLLHNENSTQENRKLVREKIESEESFFSFLSENRFFSTFSNLFNASTKKDQLRLLRLLPSNKQNRFFKPMLKQYFDVKKILGDGNCCVYALMLGQNPNMSWTDLRNSAPETRLHVVRHMKANRLTYKEFCSIVPEKQTPLEIQWIAYQEKIAKKVHSKIPFSEFIANQIAKLNDDELNQSIISSQYNFELDKFKKSLKKGESLNSEQLDQRFQTYLTSKYQRNADGDRDDVSFEEYTDAMLQNGIQFGTQEIKAFAECEKIPVIVYNPNNIYIDDQNDLHPMESCVYGAEFLNTTARRIYLYHKNGNHYELMVPKNNQVIPRPGKPTYNV